MGVACMETLGGLEGESSLYSKHVYNKRHLFYINLCKLASLQCLPNIDMNKRTYT